MKEEYREGFKCFALPSVCLLVVSMPRIFSLILKLLWVSQFISFSDRSQHEPDNPLYSSLALYSNIYMYIQYIASTLGRFHFPLSQTSFINSISLFPSFISLLCLVLNIGGFLSCPPLVRPHRNCTTHISIGHCDSHRPMKYSKYGKFNCG